MRPEIDEIEQLTEDEATTGFIDIQFGLIAILILALGAAASGLRTTAHQLRMSEAGSSEQLELLLCTPVSIGGEDVAPADLACEENTFAGHGGSDLEFYRPESEPVLVLSLARDASSVQKDSIGTFRSGESSLPGIGADKNAFEEIGKRMDVMLPCFAPLDRSVALNDAGREGMLAIIRSCEGTYYPKIGKITAEAGVALPDSDIRSGSSVSGIDLVLIEGHADGEPPGSDNIAEVAENRARSVLLALLDPVFRTKSVPDTTGGLARALDNQAARLGENRSDFKSALIDLIPLSSRLVQECMLATVDLESLLQNWCDRLLDVAGDAPDADVMALVGGPAIGGVRKFVPRIFALSSYGRFSLRFGSDLNQGDPHDRRVEIRIHSAAIPQRIHELVEETQHIGFYRLYSAAAVVALHRCDLEREADGDCLYALDALVRRGSG